jgi:hypothetical protein
MNKRLLIISSLIIAAFWFTSCGGGGSSGPEQTPIMNGLVNSTNWRSPDPRAILTDHSIKVYGTSANGQTVILNINSGVIGEYTLSATNGNYAEFIPNMSTGASRFSTSNSENGTGFVRISSINEEAKTMSGTFSFKAYRTTDNTFKTLSDGTFSNVPYQYYNTTDTTEFDNIFLFSDNNQSWNAPTISAFRNDTALVIIGECDRAEAWQSVTMWMAPTITAGVHYISPTGPVWARFQQGFYTFPAVNGSVTIIENNQSTKIIRGTFFFNYVNSASQTMSVTGGQFEVEYEDLTDILDE